MKWKLGVLITMPLTYIQSSFNPRDLGLHSGFNQIRGDLDLHSDFN